MMPIFADLALTCGRVWTNDAADVLLRCDDVKVNLLTSLSSKRCWMYGFASGIPIAVA
jgi:hypothetical protein